MRARTTKQQREALSHPTRIRLLLCCIVAVTTLGLIRTSSTVLVKDQSFFFLAAPPTTTFTELKRTKTSNYYHHRRLFVGIFTSPKADMRLRNIIRTTYLEIFTKLGGSSWPSICSLAEFTSRSSSTGNTSVPSSSCQIVYSFVAEGQFKPNPKNQFAPEIDMIYLNITTNDSKSNRVHRLYEHLLGSSYEEYIIMNPSFSSSSPRTFGFPFDFVAHTHSRVVLYPDRVWPRELFGGGVGDGGASSSSAGTLSVFSHSKVYFGAVSSDSNTNRGAPRTRIKDYVALSFHLLKQVMAHPSFHAGVSNEQTEMILERIIDDDDSSHTRIVHDPSTMMTPEEIPSLNTTIVIPLKDSTYLVEDDANVLGRYIYVPFITQWDAYKDTWLVTYKDPEEEARIRSNPRISSTVGTCQYGPRVLLGIFTMKDDAKEIKRRAVIRETYLSYYKSKNSTLGNHRICSLADIVSSDHPDQPRLLQECQIAYVFVAGGNPDGPPERVHFNASIPMTLPASSLSDEKDLVLLNIRENMKDGKSQSFFKYATSIVDEHVYFDYIAKTDSDTLIYPDNLLNHTIRQLPRFPDNVRVYGGSSRAKERYGELKGPIYNQGSFYWMSVDLARYIASRHCDRKHLVTVYSEDVSIGNFVHSHPLPIHRFKVQPSPKSFDHPVKQLQDFRTKWKKYLSTK